MKKRLWFFLILILFTCAVSFSLCEAGPSLIHRAFSFLNYADSPVHFNCTLQFEKSPFYGEERTSQLNRLLKHFVFDGTLGDNLWEMTVSLDQQNLFSLSEIQMTRNHSVCLTPGDKEDSYILPDAAVSDWPSSYAQYPAESYLREKSIFLSLASFRSLIGTLPEAFPDKTGTSKITEKYRYYGTAVKRITVNITGEELNEYIRKNLGKYPVSTGLFPDLSTLFFENRQGFTLLFTEENRLISVTYSGKIRFPEEDLLREVRLDWKTVQTDQLEKNELTLRTPNSDRTRKDNYILDSQWDLLDDGSETFHWNAQTDLLSDNIRTQKKITSEWSAAGSHLSGSFSETDLSDRAHPSAVYLVETDVSDSSEYKGTLEIIDKNDKIELSRILIGFQLFPAFSEPVSALQPDARTLMPEEYPEIIDSLESFILRKIIRLPEEDLSFIREGLPESVWNQLLIDK